MTRNELSKAVALAQTDVSLPKYIGPQSVDCPFDGFALSDFEPVTCTIRDLAALVRYQCMQLNGELDTTALNEIAECGKRKFTIVGLGDDDIETHELSLPHWFAALL